MYINIHTYVEIHIIIHIYIWKYRNKSFSPVDPLLHCSTLLDVWIETPTDCKAWSSISEPLQSAFTLNNGGLQQWCT